MADPRRALDEVLAQGKWPPIVLVSGDDDAQRKDIITRLENALPESERDTGVDRFDAAPMARVLDAARTRPLFGGRRVILVRNPEGLSSASDTAREALLDYLDHPPDHAALVLVVDKLDKRQKLSKALLKAALHLECARPREREMPNWIAERARELGLDLRGDAIQLLADAAGTNTALAARELDKIALLGPGEKGALGAGEIEEVLGPGRAIGAFALEDALLAGKGGEALDALGRHLAGAATGEELALLGRLAAICRRLLGASAVLEGGGGDDEVREALGCHPFVAKKYARAARRQARRAERALAACVVADGMLKSGRNGREALTRVVLTLAPPSRS